MSDGAGDSASINLSETEANPDGLESWLPGIIHCVLKREKRACFGWVRNSPRYLKLKYAVCSLPSANLRTMIRHFPAKPFAVFQLNCQ
jgi:hypothetical protein